MSRPWPRRPWILPAVFFGVGYALVGILFAISPAHVQMWRLAAWAVSAAGCGAHIAYECVRRKNSPGPVARHVALAVAIGGFGVAVGANLHAVSAGTTGAHQNLLLLSLVLWPVLTALPAFLVALVVSVVLTRVLGTGAAPIARD